MSGGLVRASYDDRERAIATDLDEPLRELPQSTVTPRRRRTRFLLSVFSSLERQGRLRLGRRVFCVACFGNIDLDLREATLERDVLTVVALGLFAAIDVYVPEGIAADIGGVIVFGHRDANGNDVPPVPGSPLVRFTVFGLFAGVDLWRVPLGWATRTWGQVIEGIERGEHLELGS
ncbi:MAG TPA: hypothetical protein VKO84_11235 [Gaiellaceae bacterium]|nr:hypothetical protein [Gaiellaceae bacterium]